MAYPHTGSQLTQNGRNTTRTALSTNIIIQVDGNPIGAVQSLSIDESRSIKAIEEVGTDGVIDSAPQNATKISGSCERVRFDGMRIATAFSRGFVHVAAQRIPFDIVILDIYAADETDNGFSGEDKVITTVIKNVWITKIGLNYRASDFIITENMGWQAEHIYSYLGQGKQAAPGPEARQIPIIDLDPFERAADLGKRRGALDAAGLIRVVDSLP